MVREIHRAELDLIRPLFLQVFASNISAEMLEWKYGEKRGKSYGAFSADGTLLAHCGMFYRQVMADGQSRRIAQLGDLMALPGRHGGLSRTTSPFSLLIHQVLENLSAADNPDALAFGFPSDRAMRLGEHLGLFSSIDRMCELVFSPLVGSGVRERCVLIDPADPSFPRIADRLWQQMETELGNDLLGVRDAAYLQQRYFCHPHNSYSCYLVLSQWLRRPVGLLVTRRDGEQCELLDMIAPPANMELLLRVARQQLASWGSSTMKLWLTEKHASRLSQQAAAVNPLEFRIMANPFSSVRNPERFAGRWWLTSGDTDYR